MNWIYSNRSLIYNGAPSDTDKDTRAITSNEIWKQYPNAILATWASDWDCEKTDYWYCIKDTPFDIALIKAKRRYEINKGIKNFIVKEINPKEYVRSLYEVYIKSQEGYEQKNLISLDTYTNNIKGYWDYDPSIGGGRSMIIFGAFDSNNVMCGYARIIKYNNWCAFSELKTCPSEESKGVNAAIVYGILESLKEELQGGNFYISDGARNVMHKTHFQDYLEKYFEFRKSYCRLNIHYNPKYKYIVKLLYPIRSLLQKFDDISVIHGVNAVLSSEYISKQSKQK